MKALLQKHQKRKEDNNRKLTNIFGDERELGDGYLIIKIKSSAHGEGLEDFYKLFKKDALEEDTFQYGDNNNNTYLIYLSGNKQIGEKKLTDKIQVVEDIKLDSEGVVRNNLKPNEIPKHIRSKLQLVKSETRQLNDVFNKFNKLNMNGHTEFFNEHFQRGKVYILKDVRFNPKWRREYEKYCHIEIARICKSCLQRARGGANKCCPNYDGKKRRTVLTILDWGD